MDEDKSRDLKEIVARRLELFKRKPEAALYRPRVSSRHVSGLYTETLAREHTVRADYARAAGGTDRAPNPIELLLSAFAACIESAFYEFALHRGFTINALSVELEGTLDLRGFFMIGDVPARFQDLRYTFHIDTPDDREAVQALAREVVAHCPVVDSLVHPVPVSGDIIIKE